MEGGPGGIKFNPEKTKREFTEKLSGLFTGVLIASPFATIKAIENLSSFIFTNYSKWTMSLGFHEPEKIALSSELIKEKSRDARIKILRDALIEIDLEEKFLNKLPQ